MKEKYFKKFEGLNSIFCIQLLAMVKINDYFGKPLLIDEKVFSKQYVLFADIFQSDIDRIREFVFAELVKNPSYLNKINIDAITDFEAFKKRERVFEDEIVKSNTPAHLKKWIRNFVEIASHTTRLGFVAELFVGYEDFWPNYIGISKEDFAILSAPEELSFTKEFDLEIAKVKLGLVALTPKQISERYYWVLSNYNVVDLVDEKYVSDHIQSLTKESAEKIVRDTEHYLDEVIENKHKVNAKLNLDKHKKELLNAIASFIVLQDKRKEIILKTNSIFLKAAKKLLDYYEINGEERKIILSAAYPFWFSDLSKEDLQKMSKEAFKCFYFPYVGDIKIGDEALKEYELEHSDKHVEKTTEIKGRTAYPGQVSGKVRLILRGEDFNKFATGEILVASMTRPEFVPLMKKAVAIITDEGGITCHAAIVSRELKKPCIIGTRIATKILKDGDFVEVDANSGIVKIIQ